MFGASLGKLLFEKVTVGAAPFKINPAVGINNGFHRKHRLNQLRIKFRSITIHPQGECLELC
jgi:hypothetical protein